MEGYCTVLCDTDDLTGVCGSAALKIGFGRHRRIRSLAIELQTIEASCGASDIKIYSKADNATATPPWHYIGSLDLDATDDVGISMISIDGIAAAPMAFIKAVHSGSTCSTGPRVVIHRRGALEND
jgi:hypothetical protein